ncbi:MAG: substrate-binding domain-containing protein, partial [Polyangiaceae bacterium]|nr:substrate-binding domain-containing protein [Polyangiaceae bacterium]
HIAWIRDEVVLAQASAGASCDSLPDCLRQSGTPIGRADPAVAPLGRQTEAMIQAWQELEPRLATLSLQPSSSMLVASNAAVLATWMKTRHLEQAFLYRSQAQQNSWEKVIFPLPLSQRTLSFGIAVAANLAKKRSPAQLLDIQAFSEWLQSVDAQTLLVNMGYLAPALPE